jgi:hypothetical protein
MKVETKDKLLLWKRYFETGFGLLNYLKYPLVLLGIAIPNAEAIVFISIFYALFCFFLGWAWINSDFYRRDIELTNKYNIFVDEMRASIPKYTDKKI